MAFREKISTLVLVQVLINFALPAVEKCIFANFRKKLFNNLHFFTSLVNIIPIGKIKHSLATKDAFLQHRH